LTPLAGWKTFSKLFERQGKEISRTKDGKTKYRAEHIDHAIGVLGKWTKTHKV